jgi:hypothetical protein
MNPVGMVPTLRRRAINGLMPTMIPYHSPAFPGQAWPIAQKRDSGPSKA